MNAFKKLPISAEVAYLIGTFLLGWGTSWMTLADFGVSMIVAPAYMIFLKLSHTFTFLTFGMTQYLLQAVMLLVMIVVLRRFRWTYLLAFANAVMQGVVLDITSWVTLRLPIDLTVLPVRLILYCVGIALTTLGVAFMFRTYLSPAVYELIVKEVADHFHLRLNRVKISYDITSYLTGLLFSFLFFGFTDPQGIRIGTLLVALINSTCINMMGKLIDRFFVLHDALPWRPYFTAKNAGGTQ